MTTRKFRALTDGPGWKKGDVYAYDPQTNEEFAMHASASGPLLEPGDMKPPYFEEIKLRKIAVYHLEICDDFIPPKTLYSPQTGPCLTLASIEERD